MALGNNPTSGNLPMNGTFIPQSLCILHLSSLPLYKGKEGSIELEDFLERVEEASIQWGWSDNEKKYAIKDRLCGEARMCIKEYGEEIQTYEDIVKVLKKNFGVTISKNIALMEFMSFKQPVDMPVERFIAQASQKSKNLGLGTGDAAEEQRKRMLLSMILSNLNPEIARGVIAKDPKNLEELKSSAIREEQAWLAYKTSLNPFRAENVNSNVFHAEKVESKFELMCDKMLGQMEELNIRLNKLERNQNYKRGNNQGSYRQNMVRKEITCFRCKKKGHIAKFCREIVDEQDLN